MKRYLRLLLILVAVGMFAALGCEKPPELDPSADSAAHPDLMEQPAELALPDAGEGAAPGGEAAPKGEAAPEGEAAPGGEAASE